ncbi:MAG TPA: transglycosylase SLT domain-containing protein [Candidatus Saccharimonadia bacterium]|nr:transglycosylase SLT domain-containing protein [Candidatus Saccharimonadia bacterium]
MPLYLPRRTLNQNDAAAAGARTVSLVDDVTQRYAQAINPTPDPQPEPEQPSWQLPSLESLGVTGAPSSVMSALGSVPQRARQAVADTAPSWALPSLESLGVSAPKQPVGPTPTPVGENANANANGLPTPSAALTPSSYAPSSGTGSPDVERWSSIVAEAARAENVPEWAIKGLMEIESGGDPEAVSSAGAQSLMQVMPFHFKPGENPKDPRTNIFRGAKVYGDALRRYGDPDKAAAAYFGAIDGQGNVTSATDGSSVDGHEYVRLFRQAASKYGGASPNAGAGAANPAPAAPPAPPAAGTPPAAGGSSGLYTVRDQWGNTFTMTPEAFRKRPGGAADLTVLSTPQESAQGDSLRMALGDAHPMPEDASDSERYVQRLSDPNEPVPPPLRNDVPYDPANGETGPPPGSSAWYMGDMQRQPLAATMGPDTATGAEYDPRDADSGRWEAVPSDVPPAGTPVTPQAYPQRSVSVPPDVPSTYGDARDEPQVPYTPPSTSNDVRPTYGPPLEQAGPEQPAQPKSPFKPLYDAGGAIVGYVQGAVQDIGNTVATEGIATPIGRGIANAVTRPLLGKPPLPDSGQPETTIDRAIVETGRSLGRNIGAAQSGVAEGNYGEAAMGALGVVGDLAPSTTLARQLNEMVPKGNFPIVGEVGLGDAIMTAALVRDAARLGYGAIKVGGRLGGPILQAIKDGVPAERFGQWMARNAENVAAADARMAAEGSTVAPGVLGQIPEEFGRPYPPIKGRIGDFEQGALGEASAEMIRDSRMPREAVHPDLRAAGIGPEITPQVDTSSRLNAGFGVVPDEAPRTPRDIWESRLTEDLGVRPREEPITEPYTDSTGRQVTRARAAEWRVTEGPNGPEMAQYRPNFFGNAEEIPGTRQPLDAVYRVISREDYEGSLRRGFLQSDGRLNLDAREGTVASTFEPSPFYNPKNGEAVAVRIRVDPQDGWRLDHDGYIKTPKPIPVDRIERTLAYTTNEMGNAVRYAPGSQTASVTAGTLPPSAAPDRLSAVNRVLGQGVASSVSGGVGAAVNQEMNPDDPYAGVKGFAVGAVAPYAITKGMRAIAARQGGTAGADSGLLAMFGQAPGAGGFNPNAVQRAVQRAQRQASPGLSPLQWVRKLFAESGYSSMIGPATFTVNLTGNVAEPLYAIPKETTRGVARAISTGNASALREPGEMAAGAFHGLSQVGSAMVDALTASGKYAPTPGHEPLSAQTQNPIGKAITTGLEAGGRVFSALPDAVFGTIAQGAGEARAAAQQATDAGLKGTAWKQHVNDLLTDAANVRAGQLPTLSGTQTVIDEGAAYAKRQTFQDDLGTIGKKARNFATVGNMPVVGNLVTPFFNTPWNMNTRLAERSPIGFAMNSQGSKFDKMYDATLGSALMIGLAAGPVASGVITGGGPDDPQKKAEMRSQGWRPYSTLIDGVYVPNRVMGIYAPLLNAAADVHDSIAYSKDKSPTSIASNYAGRLGQQLQQQPYLQGISSIMQTIQAGYGGGLGSAAERYASSTITRMVPYAATARTIGTALDPNERTVDSGKNTPASTTISQQVQSGIGARGGLPIAQDVLGRPQENQQQGVKAVFARTSAEKPDPTVKAFLDAGVDIGFPKTKLTVDTIPMDLTPDETRRWNTYRGEILQRFSGNLTSRTFWSNPEARKVAMEDLLRQANDAADQRLMQSIGAGDIRRRVLEARQQQRETLRSGAP